MGDRCGAVFGLTAAAFQILARLALTRSRSRGTGGRRAGGRSWSVEKRRNKFSENYLENWDRAPVVIMDDAEQEYERSMAKYANHYLHQPSQVSLTGRYDLNNLNTDYFTTTTSPWDSLMVRTEPLPGSWVENILSNYQKKADKQGVENDLNMEKDGGGNCERKKKEILT